jgi:hypothetical protein
VVSGLDVKEKVQGILTDWGLHVTLTRTGFQVPYESTAVNIAIVDQESRVLVKLWAMVLRDVQASPALYEWVATEGSTYHFGHAVWNFKNDDPGFGMLSFDHTLLGDYLDADELKQAVVALATTADELDDQLRPRFGGKRWVDD